MAEYFLQKIKPGAFLAAEAGLVLRKHSWPGNIRELRNVITKTAVMAVGDEIAGGDLAAELSLRPFATKVSTIAMTADTAIIDKTKLEGIESRRIRKVRGQTNGQTQRAGALRGRYRRKQRRKLKI